MARPLTIKAIENVAATGARQEIPDGHTRGLFFIKQPSGAASWALRYRVAGKSAKLTLGPYPAIGLKAARELAAEAHQRIARGENPSATKREAKAAAREEAARASDLVENVVPLFVRRYAVKMTKEASAKEAERLLTRDVVGRWKGRRLGSITRADVHAMLDEIVDRGSPIAANRTLAALRRLSNWAVERGIIDEAPTDKVKAPSPERSRDRVLTDAEIRLAWQAFEGIGWPFGPLAKLLLLTGARRDEIAEGTWNEIDPDAATWTLPKERSKNGAPHEIPLSPAALEILRSLPRVASEKGWVFTSNGRNPVSGFSKAKEAVDRRMSEAAGEGVTVPHWTFHDLRRTSATGMAGLGIAPHVVEAVLNHKSGTIKGVAAVYNRFNYSKEKRAALDAWASRLHEIISEQEKGNVVSLVRIGANGQ